MATRRDEPAELKKKATPAKKTAGARTTPAKKTAAPRKRSAAKAKSSKAGTGTKPASSGEGLLRAGLKALDNVRNDVAKRQASVTNVIEGLLGIGGKGGEEASGAKAVLTRGFPGLDSFGIRKFEDVFDQRVATALQRLGMPTAEEVQALQSQIAALAERLDRLEQAARGGKR
ncbi:phasin family protein [Variovorax sp. UC122_21]|uniref:phasin family protein n=1 Tax=Variovorax TaxID=34072 RepID=UPI00193427D1|nr:phasin family protein [Variovorax paradoxus]